MRIGRTLAFLALWFSWSALRAQEYDASCGPIRQQMAALIEQQKRELPFVRFAAYLHFLGAAPEEPSDCVHRELRERIAEILESFLGLKIKEDQHPWRISYCDAVDKESHRCLGPDADDTALLPDSRLLMKKLKLEREPFVKVDVRKGYDGHIVDVFGGSRQLMQDGANPILLKRKGLRITTSQLRRFPDPVVIIIWQRYRCSWLRKFVWYLENSGS